MKAVITGCGRSGTQTMARVLQNLFVDATHETVFHQNHSEEEIKKRIDEGKSEVEVSWLAAPYLHLLYPDIKIVHLIRNPLHVIRCWRQHHRLIDSDMGVARFIRKWVPRCEEGSALDRAVSYVYCWNDMVKRKGRDYLPNDYMVFSIEELYVLPSVMSLFKFMELDVSEDEVRKNHIDRGEVRIGGCGQHEELEWIDLSDTSLVSQIMGFALENGYKID
jgi:hypothetical protein